MSGALTNWSPIAASLLFMFGAVASLLAAAWVARHGDRQRPDRNAAIGALVLTGGWCIAASAFGQGAFPVNLAEAARNLAWLVVLFRLFGTDGRDTSLAPIRPVVVVLALVVCLQPLLAFTALSVAMAGEYSQLTFQVSTLLHVLVAVGALVLLHNLYGGASTSSRQLLRWSSAAMAAMWAFDLNLYTIAYLGGELPRELGALRGLVALIVAVPVALGSRATSAGMNFRPSRAVAFQTLSLLVIGAYLLGMLAIARSLSLFVGDLGRLTQVGFVVAATALALLWLPSKRLRGWLRVTLAKHFFQHRYDYRAEWLRFNATIGSGGANGMTLQERAVQAVADIADCSSGLLLVPSEDGSLELAARWQWPDLEVPPLASGEELAALLERDNFILDLDQVRRGEDRYGESGFVPQWLLENNKAWAMVPLAHFDRLVGVVVLARPSVTRALDWEDFDLLRVVGQQLASYLAEHVGQLALMEANRFDEFSRRIAFVMHDIKNLSSQLSLLLRNAEKHADNPEFRADMLVTLKNSADKLNALLARLSRYGTDSRMSLVGVDLSATARAVAARHNRIHSVSVVAIDPCVVTGDPDAIDQAIAHLIQNAIEASEPGNPVVVEVAKDGVMGRVEIIDSGCGMSPHFIRSSLFRPFVSSKQGGFGIGAFEARELVRAMGGRMDVESREGLGTRFTISLPLRAAASLLQQESDHLPEVA